MNYRTSVLPDIGAETSSIFDGIENTPETQAAVYREIRDEIMALMPQCSSHFGGVGDWSVNHDAESGWRFSNNIFWIQPDP